MPSSLGISYTGVTLQNREAEIETATGGKQTGSQQQLKQENHKTKVARENLAKTEYLWHSQIRRYGVEFKRTGSSDSRKRIPSQHVARRSSFQKQK
jgi:hypothetical protein